MAKPAERAQAFLAESLLHEIRDRPAGYGRISCDRAQKKIVAITIATPGMPKAQRGPNRGSCQKERAEQWWR